jgi:hypothetical protein
LKTSPSSRWTPDGKQPPRIELRDLAPGLTWWVVRLVVDREDWVHKDHINERVSALSSVDAVRVAREQYYGGWATAADRRHMPLRVVEVFEVAP